MQQKLELPTVFVAFPFQLLFDDHDFEKVKHHFANKELSFNFSATLTTFKTHRKIILDMGATFAEDQTQCFEGYFIRGRDITNQMVETERIANQNNKLTAIFESGSQHVFTFNSKYIITQFNKNLRADIWYNFNYALQEGKSGLKTWLGVIAKDEYENILAKVQLVFAGEQQQFEMQFKIKDTILWREVFLYPIKNELNEIEEIVGISHNITVRKRSERQLKLQQSKLLALLDSGTHHIYSITQNGTIHAFNTNFQEFCRRFLNIELEDNNTSIMSVYNSDEPKLKEHIRLAFKGIPQFFEMCTSQNLGEKKYYEIYFTPIVEAEPEIEEVSVLAINVTENHNNNIKLFNQAAKLNTVIETSSLIFFTVNKELSLTSFNSRFEEIYVKFFSKKPFLGLSEIDFSKDYSSFDNSSLLVFFLDFWHTHFDIVLNGDTSSFEHNLISPTGESFWLEVILAPIFDKQNKVTEISIIGQVANERKLAELKLKQSLQEKEVLLKEVHHRVKNNLQVISSLLNLQSDFVEDIKILKVLKESQNRVKSMSYIHEILYQTNEFGNIPFEQYLKSILFNLVDSYRKVGLRVSVETNFEEINIDLDTSIPCGLIVNELVSNSLKYAFEDRTEGKIIMTCKNVGSKIELSIKDNGKGFPTDFDVKNAQSLGMQLVFALTEQIDGTIEIINNNGSEFLINFAPQKISLKQ
ncbi:MAG: PAS domain-containing protein [Bacteroidia bacterium]|nr:PAS domain-containing protein [Bacteroidia bacterium]